MPHLGIQDYRLKSSYCAMFVTSSSLKPANKIPREDTNGKNVSGLTDNICRGKFLAFFPLYPPNRELGNRCHENRLKNVSLPWSWIGLIPCSCRDLNAS